MSAFLVALSSCAFPGRSFSELHRLAKKRGWTIELSSGFRFEANLPAKIVSSNFRGLVHNYFPPPRTPFVLNLASAHAQTRTRSIAHARKAIRLAARVQAPFYSVHAGFCVEPSPNELGHSLARHTSRRADRPGYWKRFLRAIRTLLKDADRAGIDLLIENNVVSRENARVPLLCADTRETSRLFQEIRSPRLGLLVDTGHLKVSAHTLSFAIGGFINGLKNYIRAFHHSDNDGRSDSNQPLGASYWFLPWMPSFRHTTHIIEVCDLSMTQAQTQLDLLRAALFAREGSKLKC
jgi:sugar phosphate isomerase/epimerase